MPSWTIPVRADSARASARGTRSPLVRKKALAGVGWNTLLGLANGYETREKVTSPYLESGWIHACLKPIGQAVASVRGQLWVGDPLTDKNARLLTGTDNPIAALFDRPNPLQTMAQFFEAGVIHRKLDGEDFWFLLDLFGNPVETDKGSLRSAIPDFILPVRGAFVQPVLNQLGMPMAWTFRTAGGRLITAPASSVIQFKDYNPDDQIRGLGDVDATLSDVDLEWQAIRYQRAILKHAGDPGGTIAVETPLAPEEQNATENEANEALSIDNAGRWRVLAGKNVQYIPNKLSPRDMQFKELQAWLRDKIAGILGVPLPIIGVLDQATYSNFGQAIELFWKGGNGICSYMNSVEDVVNRVFLPRFGELAAKLVFRFDLKSVKALQEDKGKQYEIALRLAGAGLGISLDEAIQLVGIDADVSKMPYSGSRLVQSTLVPIESIEGSDGQGMPQPDPTADPAAAVGLPGVATPVQDTALNGAQISSLLEVLAAVSAGSLSPEGAIALIVAVFPGITEEEARKIVSGAKEKPPEPAPAATPASPPPADGTPPPADNSGKSLAPDATEPREQPVSRGAAEDAFAERRSYWAKHEKATLVPGESALKRAYVGKKGWRRKYEAAQLARIRAFAETGKAAGSAAVGKDDPSSAPKTGGWNLTEADLQKLLLGPSEWSEKMQKAFEPHLRSIFSTALQDMADELDVEMLSPTDPRVIRFLTDQVISLAHDHTATLAEKVRDVLVEQLSKVTSTGDLQQAIADILPELTDALKTSFSDRESRALTIARTETAKAANGARNLQMQDAGVTEQEWVTSGDAAVRGTPGGPYADAQFSHYALDGATTPVGQEFDHANHPGLKYPSDPDAQPGDTINCFASGTMVSGRFVAGSKARYAGPVRELKTARGHRLTLTPNHPVLTTRGWVPAGELREGDELLAHRGDVSSGVLRDVDHEQRPAVIEDVFETLAADGTRRSEVVGALDFHGDAARFVGDVEIVGAEGDLQVEASQRAQSCEQLALVPAHAVANALELKRASGDAVDGVLGSAPMIPCSGELPLDGRSVPLEGAPLFTLSIGPAADLNARVDQGAKDRCAADPVLVRELLQAGAGAVVLDQLVEVREVHLDGHVFDLQSTTGWIVAGGLFCGNCRCAARAKRKD